MFWLSWSVAKSVCHRCCSICSLALWWTGRLYQTGKLSNFERHLKCGKHHEKMQTRVKNEKTKLGWCWWCWYLCWWKICFLGCLMEVLLQCCFLIFTKYIFWVEDWTHGRILIPQTLRVAFCLLSSKERHLKYIRYWKFPRHDQILLCKMWNHYCW